MSPSSHNVYLIISKKKGFYKTYVGYAKNIKNRLNQHNSNKGAKKKFHKSRNKKKEFLKLFEKSNRFEDSEERSKNFKFG